MRSFLFAGFLATSGFFGFKNLVEPQLNDQQGQISQQQIINQKLETARQFKTQGDFQKAKDAYQKALLESDYPEVIAEEFSRFLKTEQNDLRGALSIEFLYPKNDVERQKAKRALDDLNTKLFNPNDFSVGTRHIIKSGETLAKIAERYGTNKRILQLINKFENPNRIHAGKAIKVIALKISCSVSLSKKELIAFDQNKDILKVYSVGIGSQTHPTPLGTFEVAVMQKSPPFWSEPGKPPIPAGDPRNPLGTRWMGFNGDYSSYGIHGTNDDSSIGHQSSKGCIRMVKQDIEELFNLADYGMKVEIKP